ncbi:MAG: putative bifunctional diguanylate cyclase/phosphodiesterase [Roseicyclus sp.]
MASDITRNDGQHRAADGARTALARTEAQIRAATEASNVALWHYCPETGETWFNSVWYTLLGYAPDAFAPSLDVFLGMMHPDDIGPTKAAFARLLNDEVSVYRADFRLRRADGGWLWLGATGTKVDRRREGLPGLVCGMQTDVSARKETERQLADAARSADEHRMLLSRLAENSPAALFEFRMDAAGIVTLPYTTSGAHELLGVARADLDADGPAVFRNILPEDMPGLFDAIEASRAGLTPFRFRFRVARADGSAIWVQANSMPQRLGDGVTTWMGSLYDVTPEVEREAELARARDDALALQRQMRELALHDGLTGLPNRRYFDTRLEERRRAAEASEAADPLVIVRIDLDRFKYVNDALGNAAGDAVLNHVASVIRTAIDAPDFASRVGGDEFSILMGPGRTVADARAMARKIQSDLAYPYLFEGKVCRFGASVGIAASDEVGLQAGDLMSFADAALYRAKARGRGHLEVFSTALHDEILEARRMAARIETALDNGAFVPFFQPQICARTGRLVGLEALARWQTEDEGVIPPNRFLPVAEQIRVVPLIDAMVLAKTEAIVESWAVAGFLPPKISFNVSAGRLQDRRLAEAARSLQRSGVRVSYELLETILLEEVDTSVLHNLDRVREAGIQIEVDDFGSGHASILGLQRIRPDILKIDRRLVSLVAETDTANDMVHAIVSMARSLSIRTTAEGVETEAQAATLREIGCDVLQGFLFARPLPAEELLAWCRAEGRLPTPLRAASDAM